jgi:hypothetical protein
MARIIAGRGGKGHGASRSGGLGGQFIDQGVDVDALGAAAVGQ